MSFAACIKANIIPKVVLGRQVCSRNPFANLNVHAFSLHFDSLCRMCVGLVFILFVSCDAIMVEQLLCY